MSRQWIRKLRLTVTGGSGEIDLSRMRVRFEIRDATTQSPRVATITITNLSKETAQKIKNEGTEVELAAGHEDNFGRIFKGEIKQKRIGRENPTDTYVIINAATAERAYNNAIVNKTLKAGSTGEDLYKACLEAMKPFGIKQGQIPPSLAKIRYPTPLVLYGMAKDHLRSLAFSAGANWNLRDEYLDVIPKDGVREGGAVVLNSATGLIGMPVQTELGVIARCLINPQIGINGTVKIDERSIQQASFDLSYAGAPNNTDPRLPSLATDGLYRVLAMDHVGDTHSQPWYCDLQLMARGGAIPEAQARMGRGGDGAGTILPSLGPN